MDALAAVSLPNIAFFPTSPHVLLPLLFPLLLLPLALDAVVMERL